MKAAAWIIGTLFFGTLLWVATLALWTVALAFEAGRDAINYARGAL